MRGLLTCLVAVMLVATLVSCGGDRNDCSVGYITMNFETEEPLFELAKKSDLLKELSKSELEYKRDIVSGLNLAVSDRIDLASILKGEGVYSEDGFIFVAFLENLQSFADENYPKAKKMFPDMTCEEFYYCSAIGYAVANNGRMELVMPADPLGSFDKTTTYTPSFEEVMTQGFCVTYCANKYNYCNVLTTISPEERDTEITLNS
jgi:hypothetical protein